MLLRNTDKRLYRAFLNKFYSNIFKCKPINEVGAEQVIICCKLLSAQLTNSLPDAFGHTINKNHPNPNDKHWFRCSFATSRNVSLNALNTLFALTFANRYMKLLNKGINKVE